MKTLQIAAATAFVTMGCAPAMMETTWLNAPPHPLAPRDPRSVELFASTPPARPHLDVALLRADQGAIGGEGTPRLVQSLLEKAGQLGCDGLFISGTTERAGAPGDLYLLDPRAEVLSGVCLVYPPSTENPGTDQPRNANGALFAPPSPPPAPAIVDDVYAGSPTR